MTFDATREADKLEQLAKSRMLAPGDAHGLDYRLCDEWGSLSQEERDAVAKKLVDKYDSWLPDDLPVPSPIHDQHGNVVGIEFKAGALDFASGPGRVKVEADKETGKVHESVRNWFFEDFQIEAYRQVRSRF